MPEELPEGYYLENFLFLLNFVEARYRDILSPEETGFCERFPSLSDDAQKALVRLLGRRHNQVRQDKCHYTEIQDFTAAIDELIAADLLERNQLDDAMDWLILATRPELLQTFPEVALPKPKSAIKKHELCCVIAEVVDVEMIKTMLPFDVLAPTCREMLETFRLLFFGNLHQDFTDFVLHELGVMPFEQYPLDVEGRYFDQRSVLDATLAMYSLQAAAERVMESAELSLKEFAQDHLHSIDVSEPLLQRRYSKVLNRVARQLERESEPELAIQLYSQSTLTPARERRARLLVGLEQVEAALDLCSEILQSPKTEAEYEFSVSFSARTVKKFRYDEPTWLPKKRADDFFIEHLTLEQSEIGVEESVVEHYLQEGAWAQHVENGLLPGLFGLLFWEVIFTPVPGAFFHPFQRGPSDLYSERFGTARQTLIEECFQMMQQPSVFEAKLIDTFHAKNGLVNPFVMWRHLSDELLSLAVKRIPIAHLETVFRRILRDTKGHRSGFPDLVVFPESGGYELVEVKGPGDTLQGNQKRWLRVFSDFDIPAKVVHVSWQ